MNKLNLRPLKNLLALFMICVALFTPDFDHVLFFIGIAMILITTKIKIQNFKLKM